MSRKRQLTSVSADDGAQVCQSRATKKHAKKTKIEENQLATRQRARDERKCTDQTCVEERHDVAHKRHIEIANLPRETSENAATQKQPKRKIRRQQNKHNTQ